MANFKDWFEESSGEHTPWGDQDSAVLLTEVESALERELSHRIMRGGKTPKIRDLKAGQVLVREGEPGKEMFPLLDGVLWLDVGGKVLAHLGPGVVVGERAEVAPKACAAHRRRSRVR